MKRQQAASSFESPIGALDSSPGQSEGQGQMLLAGPGLKLYRPYRALRGSSGILPLHFSKNVQPPHPGQRPLLQQLPRICAT